jgi:hypothetical protein
MHNTHNTLSFDRIVFNFPHSGQQRVHINRALLKEFMQSAAGFSKEGGQVCHVSVKPL